METLQKFNIRTLTKNYERFFETGLALLPAIAIGYLHFFQNPTRRFTDPLFHEMTISAAILLSGFIGYVTLKCYQSTGEIFLRWLALGFFGFTVVYAPHGLFTRFAESNLFLFMLYGPVSRLVTSVCLLVGLFHYGKKTETKEARKTASFWYMGFGVFILIDFLIALIAFFPPASMRSIRLFVEGSAGTIMLASIGIILKRQLRSPLMLVFTISLSYFVLSSLSFVLANAWDHQWWLAHAIFASGFFYLGYGVVKAFHTTRSFANVYSQEEMMAQLTASKAETESALKQLWSLNANLEQLATTDPLTGVKNRRYLLGRVQIEISQTSRMDTTFSVLAIDLDHFKEINDQYGHGTGDGVLVQFVERVQKIIRPADIIARMGGEEFTLLLPHTALEGATVLAERVREEIKNTPIQIGYKSISLTVSIGAAQFDIDGNSVRTLLETADQRLYLAKQSGRNKVMSGVSE